MYILQWQNNLTVHFENVSIGRMSSKEIQAKNLDISRSHGWLMIDDLLRLHDKHENKSNLKICIVIRITQSIDPPKNAISVIELRSTFDN